MFSGFDYIFSIGSPVVKIGFVVILAIIIARAIRGGAQWSKNYISPLLAVSARIVTKRTAISRHDHIHGGDIAMNHSSFSTTYYATFEVEAGDRMEFRIPSSEYGTLVEGDNGLLTFQGTRYKGFERL